MADPNFVQQNETPNVVLNSLAWTLHMGVSSNVRYQMLNGLDMVRLPPQTRVCGCLEGRVPVVLLSRLRHATSHIDVCTTQHSKCGELLHIHTFAPVHGR